MDHSKPLLLIDVDGVLNPEGRHKDSKGWSRHTLAGWPVQLNPQHGEWLNGLADRFELTWATTWEDEANEHIAPIVGLPQLPVIHFTDEDYLRAERMTTAKLRAVKEYVGDRPFAWLDDDVWSDALTWAKGRDATVPTLILKVDPRMGLLEHHIDKLAVFAEACSHD